MRPAPPPLTPELRRKAYQKSLELRQARAMLKEAMRIGGVTLHDAWRMDTAQGMKVYDLLVCMPRIAEVRALRLLAQAGIPEDNTVRACGIRQRDRLFQLVVEIQRNEHAAMR